MHNNSILQLYSSRSTNIVVVYTIFAECMEQYTAVVAVLLAYNNVSVVRCRLFLFQYVPDFGHKVSRCNRFWPLPRKKSVTEMSSICALTVHFFVYNGFEETKNRKRSAGPNGDPFTLLQYLEKFPSSFPPEAASSSQSTLASAIGSCRTWRKQACNTKCALARQRTATHSKGLELNIASSQETYFPSVLQQTDSHMSFFCCTQ